MANLWGEGNGSAGIAFIVSAALVYDIVSATNSSPQTTEVFASQRAETLMRWVHLGLLQAALFIAAAAWADQAHRRQILMGGVMAMLIMEISYLHARSRGMKRAPTGAV